MEEEEKNTDPLHRALAQIRKEAEKKRFLVLAQGPSAFASEVWTTVLYRESLPELHVALQLTQEELTDNTEERLLTTIIPQKLEVLSENYRVLRRKHRRHKKAEKEGLQISQENSSDSAGNLMKQNSDGFGP